MSRVGLKPLPLPAGVTFEVDADRIRVQGPKGRLETPLPRGVSCQVEAGVVRFERQDDSGPVRARHGLARALAANAVQGVTAGFERRLEIIGVGYRAAQQGRGVQFSLGYSHPVTFEPPDQVEVVVEDQNRILVRGIDRQAVGQVAARIRGLRPPDAYKGKGIRYQGETLKLKPGKSGAR